MRKVPIRLHTANALRWLGSLYRNPADALKEHVSNAIDEHVKARAAGQAGAPCRVRISLEKSRVTVEYPYGMSGEEFRDALQRVADSAKRTLDVRQIGQLGIGMFSFLQIGRKCTFHSRRSQSDETVKVVLREGSDDAEFATAPKKESLREPGIRVVISDLLFDPTKPRGSLSVGRLQRFFAERFDSYLKDGSLEIQVNCQGRAHSVSPLEMKLPRIGQAYESWPLAADRRKRIGLRLYFDPSGRGTVGIRHTGVTVVDDIRNLAAYGLEESVYAGGHVTGFIDADFLVPLPARTGFEENDDWIAFLDGLDHLRPAVEAEVEELCGVEADKRLTEIERRAIQLAREILNSDEFRDMELLEGLGRKGGEPAFPLNGFAFVPASARIDPGRMGVLRLKALVPGVVPDHTRVQLSLDSSESVVLKTAELMLDAAQADTNGVVTALVQVIGVAETSAPVVLTATAGPRKAEARIRVATAEQKREPLVGREGKGRGLDCAEVPFEDGPSKHSRYVSGVVQINTLNPDYKREMTGSDEAKLAYAALMVGKETVAFNDKSGLVNDYLERLLSFYFRMKHQVAGSLTGPRRKPRRPPRQLGFLEGS